MRGVAQPPPSTPRDVGVDLQSPLLDQPHYPGHRRQLGDRGDAHRRRRRVNGRSRRDGLSPCTPRPCDSAEPHTSVRSSGDDAPRRARRPAAVRAAPAPPAARRPLGDAPTAPRGRPAWRRDRRRRSMSALSRGRHVSRQALRLSVASARARVLLPRGFGREGSTGSFRSSFLSLFKRLGRPDSPPRRLFDVFQAGFSGGLQNRPAWASVTPALFDLADESGQIDAVEGDLKSLKRDARRQPRPAPPDRLAGLLRRRTRAAR